MRGLIRALGRAGGRPLLIGGAVIDRIYGREVKDWDIEVYGLSLSQITEVLVASGYPANMTGKAFGIIKTSVDGLDVDLSVPRRENKTGVGHRGFDVEFDPTMTPAEAGRRRDLTINSMYQDMETGEIVDPFGGLGDLRAGVLRATDPKTFVEDPLRALRVMQLLPRKGKVVAPSTLALCRGMAGEFDSLPKERVFEEFNKLLLKADKPSMGLEFLKESGWLRHFPELQALVGCEQNPDWHPEGDVWEHTLRVVDVAARLHTQLPNDWGLAYMYGAMLHDVGKPVTTTEELLSPGHDVAGVPLAEAFMRRLCDNATLIKRVCKIIACHMRPGQLTQSGAKLSAWKRLHNELRLDVCAYMSRADSTSRYGDAVDAPHPPSKVALRHFEEFGEEPIPPILMGRHLIERGLKPGPVFGEILERAYRAQIESGIEDLDLLFKRGCEPQGGDE